MKRIVRAEILDTLPGGDPRAVRSRRDLRRVNGCMRNPGLMAGALNQTFNRHAPGRITELGAGDGTFLLDVARQISPPWPAVKATLLDAQKIVSPETLAAFAASDWRAEAIVADVFDWPPGDSDLAVANLFLHHFDDARLIELLSLVSRRARCLVALEPRRGRWPWFCSRLLWGIGCNEVTRHDGVASVRAGFSGNELSALWPAQQGWRLTERRAGAFSHLFIARKIS